MRGTIHPEEADGMDGHGSDVRGSRRYSLSGCLHHSCLCDLVGRFVYDDGGGVSVVVVVVFE